MTRLRWQLIATLALVGLLPALPAALLVNSLVQRSLDARVEETIVGGTRAGLDGMRRLLDIEKEGFIADLDAGAGYDTLTASRWESLLPGEKEDVLAMAVHGLGRRAASGDVLVLAGPEAMSLDGAQHLVARAQRPGEEALWLARPLPDDLVTGAARITESIRLLEALRLERGSVTRSLVSAFLVIYGIFLVLVLVLGLVLATRLTRPLEQLAHGIGAVSGGDLQTTVPPTGGGEMKRLLGQFNDMVTRLGQQQQEIRHLEKMSVWKDMARKLAHEIKNPLTPIQLAAEQIRDQYPGEDAAFRKLVEDGTGIIQEEVRTLKELVRSFSQLGKLPEPTMRPVAAAEVFADLSSLYARAPVRIDPGALGDGQLRCDPDQIHRAMINLIGNALAAQESAGVKTPVEVTGAIEEGEIRLRVADRGPGVRPEERRRIFEPDVTSKPDGMGLGLAIVEAIARGHGGSVHVDERPGGGAVFTLSLPGKEPRPEDVSESRDPKGTKS